MSEIQCKKVIEHLVRFVGRVSEDKNASPAEVAALPEVVKILCHMTSFFAK